MICASSHILFAADAQTVPADTEFDNILSQDISELTVTSVAKRSQRLNDTAAAVYVITQEELRRAGIYSIPEALRLVPGMQVAKTQTDRWAITSRGINNVVNNKLLVLIDGRPIYTPVYSGVYWGDQSTSINDIERIEVIRGPGASIYGANAMNGVVNIITKSAEDTQGNMVSGTATAKGTGIYEARHGGKASDNSFYRAYGQYYDADNWHRERGGFRIDGRRSDNITFTLQGDGFAGDQDAHVNTPILSAPFTQNVSTNDDVYGGNILGRWNQKLTNDSELSVQAYVDHYTRNEYLADQHVTTADIQMQNTMRLNDRNNFSWGAEARLNYINIESTFYASVSDERDTHEIYSAFAQNEYAVIPDILFFTLGSKFEYNDFTGFEVQPSARMSWHPTSNQTVWAAISRAVRTPSSIEEDVNLLGAVTPAPTTEYRIFGNPNQKSEELLAYEVGYRIQPSNTLSIDATAYYNIYDNLQTYGPIGTPFVGPNGNLIAASLLNNLGEGHIYGFEVATSWNVTRDWKLSGSYTYIHLDLDESPATFATLENIEGLSPQHEFSVQSYYNITDDVHFDNVVYFVDNIDGVDSYIRYDARLAWLIQPGLEVSLIGRNLLGKHEEYPSNPPREIDRSYIGQVLWKF